MKGMPSGKVYAKRINLFKGFVLERPMTNTLAKNVEEWIVHR
jgi:hypothetical protein